MTEHTPGAGLGRAIARVLGETIIHSSAATSDHKEAARIRANAAFMEAAETHYSPILRGLFGELMAADDLPDGYREMLRHMVEPGAQFDVLLQILGLISAAIAAIFGLGTVDMQPMLNQLWRDHPSKPLTPADLADMVIRNIVDEGSAAAMAAESGISADNFSFLVKDTGESYGIDQALNLWRRGLISEGELDKVIFYSRVRDDFIPDLKQLAHDTMTGGDAVELALKQIVDEGTARDLYAKAGGLADQFDLLVQGAGNPIGPEAAVNLWAHGLIDDAQLQQVIAHSRINPIFYELAKLTHHKWLSVIQIELALKSGTVDPAQAADWLAADGYPADQIAAFVAGASSGKASAHKALSESQITELYEAGFYTRDQATAELVAIGYEPGLVDAVLAIYEQRRYLTMAQAAVGQVRKVYLAHRIDDTQASALLDELGIDPTARDHYLQVWAVEAQSEIKSLTMAQIGSAYKKGLMADADAVQRWELMGYSADDAALLLAIYGGPPPPGSPAAASSSSPSSASTGTGG